MRAIDIPPRRTAWRRASQALVPTFVVVSIVGCCATSSAIYLDDGDIIQMMGPVVADRDRSDTENFYQFQRRLFKLNALRLSDRGAYCALRAYINEPGKAGHVITALEFEDRVEVELRSVRYEVDVLWGDLRNGFVDASSVSNTMVRTCTHRVKMNSLSNLIDEYQVMDLPSSTDVSGRPLIVDGPCYLVEVVSRGDAHSFDFCNPGSGATDYDERIVGLLRVLKSWV